MKKRLACLILLYCSTTFAQHPATPVLMPHPATVKEYTKTYVTYPFGDPNPIPLLTPVYPYYRFDGFTTTPVNKEWKVIELENDYIKLLILPEIGGKIWTAIEKSSGRPFLYDNHVVKFRDIAMRGPWTSGGLESNFGIIGHTPNCSTPVDYRTRTNEDGSVTCIIGALDLLTRSNWRMEITLPKDKAYFTTHASWFNQSAVEQPYYHWMNAGLKSSGNLEFIYPGNRYIGHEGEYADWPLNKQNGSNLAWYEQNNFGGPKSYHVFGRYTDFSGAYWHDDDMGMVRYGTHDDKAGKKIWIWGLSGQGMIWEKMLTDKDGQYVEVQSGRLFNQNAEKSSMTPFKHKSLQPYESDSWTEYWYPVLGTGGFVKANDYGALNLRYEDGWLKIGFSPVAFIRDSLVVKTGDKIIYARSLSLSPLQTFTDSCKVAVDPSNLQAILGGTAAPDPSAAPTSPNASAASLASLGTTTYRDAKLVYSSAPHADDLSRPVDAPSDFDWHSAYGLYLAGMEAMDQKNYPLAETKLQEALVKDHNYLPALVKMAELFYRNMRYTEALDLIKKALSIDTEDGSANYYYGLINAQLGNGVDAKDGFDIASLDPAFRSAAYTELAKIYLKEGNAARALAYAEKALNFDQFAIEALQVAATAYRFQHFESKAMEILARIDAMDGLNHFCRFEKYLWRPTAESKAAFTSLIQNELPQETYIELATWYYRAGCTREAQILFEWCPASTGSPSTPQAASTPASPSPSQAAASTTPSPSAKASPSTEAAYWLAFLQDKPLDLSALNPALSFPFRSETGQVLEQLLKKQDYWLLKYHLALIYHDRHRIEESRQLLLSCGNDPDFAPFYAVRAAIFQEAAISHPDQYPTTHPLTDLKKALSLDDNWRYRKLLATYYMDHQQYADALSIVEPFYKTHPGHYIMGMLYAKTLLYNHRYAEADKLLSKLVIIPFEGATDGHELYRETKLMQALGQMRKAKYTRALSFIREAGAWPENLGVGKPYEEDIDYRLELWLTYQCLIRSGSTAKADTVLRKIVAFEPAIRNTIANFFPSNALVTAWSLERSASHTPTGPGSPAHESALQWLDRQSALFPDNKLLLWSRARFENRPYDLAPKDKDANARILEQWMAIANTGNSTEF